MQLVIIGLNFAPELTGVGKYTGAMAAWLAQRGHTVSVITTRPYYPEWKKAAWPARWTWESETWQGCRVIRCPCYIPRHISGPKRLLHHASFCLSSLPGAAAQWGLEKVDIVATVAPSLLSAPVALALARLKGAKAWLHFQDLEIDAALEFGIVRGSRVAAVARALERWTVARFDLVSAISEKMLAAVERKGVRGDRLMLFPNWVDMQRIFPLHGPNALRHELGIPDDACIALYSGSMGRKQGLECIIEAARQLATAVEPIVFVLAGSGPVRSALEDAAKGLTNVKFLPLQPEERFNDLLDLGDIHLLPQLLAATDLVMPSKLGPILAAGKPVIATVLRDSQIAATVGMAGIIVPPADPAALAAAIQALARDPERRRSMGAAALKIARESMEANTVLARMEARLENIAQSLRITRTGS